MDSIVRWGVFLSVFVAGCSQTISGSRADAGLSVDVGFDAPHDVAPTDFLDDLGVTGREASSGDSPMADAMDASEDASSDVTMDLPAEGDVRDTGMSECFAGAILCGDRCVDTRDDPANCGSCGHVCCPGTECFGGGCAGDCPLGLSACGDFCTGGGCRDLQSDNANCGGCGMACPTGTFCAMGGCVCADGKPLCHGTCTDVTSDPANCGACGDTCCAGEVCRARHCAAVCPAETVSCAGLGACQVCANLATDVDDCGACGNRCPAGWACTAGSCMPPAFDGGCVMSSDAGAVDAGTCCGGESVNTAFPPTSDWFTDLWIAFDYVPTCNYALTRLELHARDGEVALLDDACGMPGAVLFRGLLTGSGDIVWKGADVAPAIVMVAGRRYWIASNSSVSSIATGGMHQTKRAASSLIGPWGYPDTVFPYTFHALGRCP